jgi:uncharacterized protein (UPF0335 family)
VTRNVLIGERQEVQQGASSIGLDAKGGLHIGQSKKRDNQQLQEKRRLVKC